MGVGGLIPGRVIPKTVKMVPITFPLFRVGLGVLDHPMIPECDTAAHRSLRGGQMQRTNFACDNHWSFNSHIPADTLEFPTGLTCMFLDIYIYHVGGTQLRTHTDTGRTCKLHRERPQTRVRTRDLLANHCAIVLSKSRPEHFKM